MKSFLSTFLVFTFLVFVVSSCATNENLFLSKIVDNFEGLQITDIAKAEKRKGSQDVSANYLVTIGEDIYPNFSKHKLESPKTYKRQEGSFFTIETDYYYSTKDSIVRVILYQWDFPQKKVYDFMEKDTTTKFRQFQEKFNRLKARLSEELGQPTELHVEQDRSKFFRDDVKWASKDGLNAYLFMLGNENAYRQIRLSIYKD